MAFRETKVGIKDNLKWKKVSYIQSRKFYDVVGQKNAYV